LFTGMHKQKSLKRQGCNTGGLYKTTDLLTQHGFYLPSSSNLKPSEIEYICKLIIKFKNSK